MEDSGGSPYQVLVEHFHRCLQAEEENSRRHAETAKMVVTALVAFLAVGLFRFGLSTLGVSFTTHPEWVGHVVRVMLILGLGCLFWSFSYLTGRRSERRRRRLSKIMRKYKIGAASLLLFPREEDFAGLVEPEPGTVEYVRFRTAAQLEAAATDLARRNSLRDAGILLSQRWFVRGILAIVLGVVFYIAAGWWYAPAIEQPVQIEEIRAMSGSFSALEKGKSNNVAQDPSEEYPERPVKGKCSSRAENP